MLNSHIRPIALTIAGVALALVTPLIAAPSAPTNLVAAVNGSTVTLTWTATAAGTPVIGYRLEAGTSPGLSNIASSLIGPSAGFTANGVPFGTYYVRVRAVAADGESAPSNEVVVNVGGGCSGPPNAPVGLSRSVNGSLVTFTWTGGGGCAVTNYILAAGSAPGLSNIAVVNLGTATSLMASAPAGTYYVRVAAQNAVGTSGPSNEVSLTVGSVPPADVIEYRISGTAPDVEIHYFGPQGIEVDLVASLPWSISLSGFRTGDTLSACAFNRRLTSMQAELYRNGVLVFRSPTALLSVCAQGRY
jgi:predicted phage tail protein